jgi:hypothetical protein
MNSIVARISYSLDIMFLTFRHFLEYEDLPAGGEWAEGKRVYISGGGNAGFEVATAIQNHASEVTIGKRVASTHYTATEPGDINFAHLTHYPGDLRLRTLSIYDHYMLKAFDVVHLQHAVNNDFLV